MKIREFESSWQDLIDNFGGNKLPNKDFIFKELKSWPKEKFSHVINVLKRSLRPPILKNFEDAGAGWRVPVVKCLSDHMPYDEQQENKRADAILKTIDPEEKLLIFNHIEPYRPPSVGRDSKVWFLIPARILVGSNPDKNFNKLITNPDGSKLKRWRELVDRKWVENNE